MLMAPQPYMHSCAELYLVSVCFLLLFVLCVAVLCSTVLLRAGTYGPRWRTPNLRPYAPSYDEDKCVDAVLRLNSTLF